MVMIIHMIITINDIDIIVNLGFENCLAERCLLLLFLQIIPLSSTWQNHCQSPLICKQAPCHPPANSSTGTSSGLKFQSVVGHFPAASTLNDQAKTFHMASNVLPSGQSSVFFNTAMTNLIFLQKVVVITRPSLKNKSLVS